jgi:hypothetical protein
MSRTASSRVRAHRDDPEFGYRFLLDEASDAGQDMSERTAWRICSNNAWWSRFGKKKRYANAGVGAPAHDDLVRREFMAPAANMVWLSDLTEHPTNHVSHHPAADSHGATWL